MTRTATVTEANVRRVMKAAVECGLVVHECVIRPHVVRLVFADAHEEIDEAPVSSIEVDDTRTPIPWPRPREIAS